MADSTTKQTNGDMTADANAAPPSIEVNGLNYSFPDGSSGLENVCLSLPPGSRTLLIGGT